MKLIKSAVGLCLSMGLWAGDAWSPIPPEVWAIKSGPKGAVVLEERLRFQPHTLETLYRVRIFSEEGRQAAELPDLPRSITDIRGRTVYPDGRVIAFDSRKDFAERKVEAGGREIARNHLVAPGITTDCVVEVRWRERSDGYLWALPKRFYNGLFGQWTLGNTVPTKVSAIELSTRFPFAVSITSGGRWRPEVQESDGFKIYTYRDLPPMDVPPYALAPLLGFPKVELFWQPDDLIRAFPDGKDAYWKTAFKVLYRSDYEEQLDLGRPFRKLADEMLLGLPEAPQARAVELLRRLQERLRNVSLPTAEEQKALPKDFWDEYRTKRLDKAAATGLASGRGVRLMYYQLLKLAGVYPKIAKVVDRSKDMFNYARLNAWQFHHDLLGIDEPGKATLWLDPTNRFAAPGVIHPDYQGVPMLVFETKDRESWSPSVGVIPPSRPEDNTRSYTYALKLEEDSDQFTVKAQFTGFPEFVERHRFISQEPPEQARLLKEQFESNRKSLTVGRSEIWDAASPSRRVSWEVSGQLERESGRKREVEPFPGMTWPLWVPSKFDEARSLTIVLPGMAVQTCSSTFEVPKGYRFTPHETLTKSNAFGSVMWQAVYDEPTRKVSVVMECRIASPSQGSEQWRPFREFLGWVQEACQRTFVLTREG